MVRRGHAVGQHAGPAQAGLVMLQAVGQRPESARHGRGIDHGQHGQTQQLRQIARAEVAVEQAHHAFDKNQVGLLGRLMQALAHIRLARHPQIHRMHGRTAGQLVPVGVQKIRPALEHAHLASLARMQPSQGSRHGGLALAGGRALISSAGQRAPVSCIAVTVMAAYLASHFTPI
jgi:hypothetical protein